MTSLIAIEAPDIERVSSLVGDLARRDVSGLSHGDLLEAHDAVSRVTGGSQAGEERIYANVLLTIGVRQPDQ